MKIERLIAAFAFVATVAVSPVLAQTNPATQPTQQPAPKQTSAALPESKIALVDTEAFGDEKQGIVRLVAAAKKVEAAFDGIRNELRQMQQKIQQLTDEINKLQGGPVDPKQLQAKADQLEQLKTEAKRKQEDAEAAYPKKMQEALAPVYTDIFKALDAYGKARGITLLLDAAKLGPAILSASEAMDITRAFISDFNSKNPATAQVTTPPK
jgi:Skp family chaperone for outer membrane proteins